MITAFATSLDIWCFPSVQDHPSGISSYDEQLCKNRVRWESASEVEFERLTLPTPLQRRAFELLRLRLAP